MTGAPPPNGSLRHDERLGQELVAEGLLDAATLDKALGILREGKGKSLPRVLAERGLISDAQMTSFFAKRHGIERVAIRTDDLDTALADTIPYSLASEHTMVPLRMEGGTVQVAIANPLQYIPVEQALQEEAGLPCAIFLATHAEIREALKVLYEDDCVGDSIEILSHVGVVPEEAEEEIEEDEVGDSESAIQTLNTTLAQAVMRGASDIHIEPGELAVRIRLRVDGTMLDLCSMPPDVLPALVARVKVVSGLDIGERRLPQDGAINLKAMGRRVDIRVNVLPNIHGERVVMRVLDDTSGPGSLDEVGFTPQALSTFRDSLDASHGIILVTGPTGSGKTSTLYAALRYLNRPENNIMTVEDPVEYRISGVSQTQTQAKIGFDFARVLEAFLRQDPDIILLGEIRNEETAEIATRASLTGHMVLSTLHVQSAVEAITRMVEMGVAPYVLGSTLRAVLAQRLLRRVCRNCAEPDTQGAAVMESWGGSPEKLVVGAGCSRCGYSGFKGRLAITELFVLDDAIREAILAGKTSGEIEQMALARGMQALAHNALHKAAQGLTSMSEVMPYLIGRTPEEIRFGSLAVKKAA